MVKVLVSVLGALTGGALLFVGGMVELVCTVEEVFGDE